MSTAEHKDRIKQLAKGDEFKRALKSQVFEMIIQRALADAPWERIWSGPMKAHGITSDEVLAEVQKRKAASALTDCEPAREETRDSKEVSALSVASPQSQPKQRPRLRQFIWQTPTAVPGPIYLPQSAVPPLPGKLLVGAEDSSWRDVQVADDFFVQHERRQLIAGLVKRCELCKSVIQPGEQFCRCGLDVRALNPCPREPEELKAAVDELPRDQLAGNGEAQKCFLEKMAAALESPWQHANASPQQQREQRNEPQMNGDYKRCPRCEKWIGRQAIYCTFCHLDFTIPPEQTTPPPRVRLSLTAQEST